MQSDSIPGLSGYEQLVTQNAVPILHSVLDKCEKELDDSDWSATSPEHLLLCRLIEAPGSPIQADRTYSRLAADMKGHALYRLLQYLSSVVASTRLQTDLDSELENAKLLEYATLLQTTLMPIYFSRFQLMNANIYKPLLSSDSWKYYTLPSAELVDSGVCSKKSVVQIGLTSSEESISSIAAEIVQQNLQEIIDNFILDVRWTRSPALQSARLDLICVLGVLDFPRNIEPAKLKPAIHFSDDIAASISNAVCTTAISPSNPLSLRKNFVSFAAQALNKIRDSYSNSLTDPPKPLKLQSIQKRLESSDMVTRREDAQKKQAAAVILRSFLLLLNDSSDEIREAVLDSLSENSSLLSSSEELHAFKAANNEDENIDQFFVLWEDVFRVVLRELRVSVVSSEGAGKSVVVDKLDHLLRVLAVLDPTSFEALIRSEIAELQDGAHGIGKESNENYLISLNELISHADLLQNL